MACTIWYDDRPVGFTGDQITSRVGRRVFQRDLDYAHKGRVWGISVVGGGDITSAQSKGSGAHTYQTVVFHKQGVRSAPASWVGTCSCPVGSDCKHTAVPLITARTLAQVEPDGAVAPSGGPTPWESRLADLLQVERALCRRMALEIIDDSGDMRGTPAGLSILPLTEGKRGRNRQDAAWTQIISGGLDDDVDPTVMGVLRELAGMIDGYDFYYTDDRLPLTIVPAHVRDVLRRGVVAGLTFTIAQCHSMPVYLADRLRGGTHLTRGGDGDIAITPVLEIDDVEELRRLQAPGLYLSFSLMPIGDLAHDLYTSMPGRELLLMPLEPRPTEALSRMLWDDGEAITIPAGDVERSETKCLETLTRALPVLSADASIRMPRPTTLRAALAVHVNTAEHHLSTEWSTRYVGEDGKVRSSHVLPDLVAATEGRIEDGTASRDIDGGTHLACEVPNHLPPLTGWHPALWQPLGLRGMVMVRFMTETLSVLCELAAFGIEVDDDVPDYRETEATPIITTSVSDGEDRPDWFSLSVCVYAEQEETPLALLMVAVATGESEVLLESGTWVSIDRLEIEALARLMKEGRELADPQAQGELRISALRVGYYEALESLGVIERVTACWKERTGRLPKRARVTEAAGESSGRRSVEGNDAGGTSGRTGEGPGRVSVSEGVRATLCPYQLEGYRWLDSPCQTGLGGVSADDMGLGKTVQVLAAVQRLIEQREEAGADSRGAPQNGAGGQTDRPTDELISSGDPGESEGTGSVLATVPASVVGSWVGQAERFCPGLRVRAVRRTATKREETLAQIVEDCDVVITSYTVTRLCEEGFIIQGWAWMVCDEAQFVKNHTLATYKAVWRLRSPSTIAITGTPLENSLTDLWTLMSITAPGLLPDLERFGQAYHRPIDRGDTEALGRLRRGMRLSLPRCTREQMAADLPTKTEQVLTAELGAKHRKAYDQCLARERQRILGLLEEDIAQSRFIVLKVLTILRQMAPGPVFADGEDGMEPEAVESVDGGEAGEAGEAVSGTGGPGRKTARRKGAKGRDVGAPATGHSGPGRWPSPSAKVEVLVEHSGPTPSEGYRALVFFQFTHYLSGVCEHLETTGVRTACMDGSIPDRQKVIDAFRAGEADVFLISLKVGGFGLTLTEVGYVFLLDPWRNPQAEEQTIDHAHRIGQDKSVMVYWFVSVDIIEEKVMTLKEKKAEFFARVIEGAGEAEAGGEDADAAGDAAAVVGSGGLSPAVLTAAEIRELIEG